MHASKARLEAVQREREEVRQVIADLRHEIEVLAASARSVKELQEADRLLREKNEWSVEGEACHNGESLTWSQNSSPYLSQSMSGFLFELLV